MAERKATTRQKRQRKRTGAAPRPEVAQTTQGTPPSAEFGTVAAQSVSGNTPPGVSFPQGNPDRKPFSPFNMENTVIALPLLEKIQRDGPNTPQDIIIDVHLEYPGGRMKAKEWVLQKIATITGQNAYDSVNKIKTDLSQQYVFGTLEGAQIQELVRQDSEESRKQAGEATVRSAVYHVWPDFDIEPLINKSIRTVKADAARYSFSAVGEDILWAVVDSGIDGQHPHFVRFKNLDTPIAPQDFTGGNEPLADEFGHGTHVAGIIAGELTVAELSPPNRVAVSSESGPHIEKIRIALRQRDESGTITTKCDDSVKTISGMAPRCKLLSLKVLDANGKGKASNLITAIAYIQEINGHGRRILIHGVNMSVGYGFEPKWFACGQSPLCVEVDKLVRSGVVVVVAAGNTGYGALQPAAAGPMNAGFDITINDPGNADMAITVGSTHRDMPHIYGVSYFSSKGPTGDGRLKPDLVAPGEKIMSCAAGKMLEDVRSQIGDCEYLEDSGTSMAAPHVSGVIAAFLSVRREFIGQSEKVKKIFLSTATDLNRERYFQGHGLVDLMRAIQAV